MKRNHIILIFSISFLILIGIIMYFKLNNFQKKIVRLAKAELKKWTSLSERAVSASSILIDYWKSVGLTFTAKQLQKEDFQSSYPWSSAFISYLFHKAGAGEKFPYSSAHSTYFQKAKANKKIEDAPLRGFKISEYAPQVGDLVVYSRKEGCGYDTKGFFPSHGELIIEKGKTYIKAIGGNVSNTVKVSKYSLDKNGLLTTKEKDFFMVIQNNIK